MGTSTAVANPRLHDLAAIPGVPDEGASRLKPVEQPRGFIMRMAYWGTRKQLGKVMTPIKVVCTRLPGSLQALGGMLKFSSKGIQLDQELQILIGNLASQINGCASCIDMARALAVRENKNLAKVDAVMDYRADLRFTARERAALAYAEEATRSKAVSDATFETLRKHFTEREIVEITWVNAFQNFFNLLNRPLGIGSDGLCSIALAKASAPGK
jgi:AhpD family alkylhydroperoxidase